MAEHRRSSGLLDTSVIIDLDAALVAAGRKARGRNPADFAGLDRLLDIVAV